MCKNVCMCVCKIRIMKCVPVSFVCTTVHMLVNQNQYISTSSWSLSAVCICPHPDFSIQAKIFAFRWSGERADVRDKPVSLREKHREKDRMKPEEIKAIVSEEEARKYAPFKSVSQESRCFKKNDSEITAILNILSTHDGSSKTKILDNTKKGEDRWRLPWDKKLTAIINIQILQHLWESAKKLDYIRQHLDRMGVIVNDKTRWHEKRHEKIMPITIWFYKV